MLDYYLLINKSNRVLYFQGYMFTYNFLFFQHRMNPLIKSSKKLRFSLKKNKDKICSGRQSFSYSVTLHPFLYLIHTS